MLLLSKSQVNCSPAIKIELSLVSSLSLRMNFFCSKFCRCKSARATIELTSKQFKEDEIFLQQFPIGMSAPIVVYPQGVCVVSEIVGSGSKHMSNGCADISRVTMCFRSISSFDDCFDD